jgi:two-component system, chemotaxis family, sensor kinase Cph1
MEKKSSSGREYRKKAESNLDKQNLNEQDGLISDPEKLLHELRVHQIELDLQNEDLRQQRDRAEEATKKYSDLYTEIYDFTPLAYFSFSREGMILELNLKASELLEFERSYLIDKNMRQFLPPDMGNKFNKFLDDAFAKPGKARVEIQILKRDRSRSHCILEGTLTENESNCLAMALEINDLKKLESDLIKMNEELARSNSDLLQFAYVTSHDLQEPLRMVSSFVQLLQKRYDDKLDQDAREYIQFAVDGSKRMYDLLNGLLTYSRVHSREQEFSRVDLEEVLNKVKGNLNLMIRERDAEITSNALPVVNADEQQIIQVMQNLLENGIKFSKGQPRIRIIGIKHNDGHLIRVSDEGIGIESQYFEKIFRIFQRLHNNHEYDGTGIGLAICKRIIERHGGKIWVESKPGMGSTFCFTLPKA